MTDTPVTDTSLEALDALDRRARVFVDEQMDNMPMTVKRGAASLLCKWNAELIRTGRIRLETPAQKETDDE